MATRILIVALSATALVACAPSSVGQADHANQASSATTAGDLSCTGACVQDSEIQAVSWSKLTGVPLGFADGVDDDTTYSAGPGLALDGTTFSIPPGGVGSELLAPDASIGHADHATDAVSAATAGTAAGLSCSGPCVHDAEIEFVSWSKLTGVPAGLADGVDNDTTYSAGAGLALVGNTFSVPSGAIRGDMVATGALNESNMLTPHMGIVTSTTDVVVRGHYMAALNGVTTARVRIVSGGNNATWAGSGTATVLVNGTVVATFTVGGDGNLPWTYITSPIAIASGYALQVKVRATDATKPVVLRDVDIDFQ